MSGTKRTVVSLVLVVALLSSTCVVRPTPVYATDTTTVALAVGGTIVGLMIIALIVTLVVRNNAAWMPALPQGDATLKSNPWAQPESRVRFGSACGIRDGAVPLVCW